MMEDDEMIDDDDGAGLGLDLDLDILHMGTAFT
jgi:hypothetical protein